MFSLNNQGKIQYAKEDPGDRLTDVENAADVCPMQVISFSTA